MLVQFTVKNHRSIAEETTLSYSATKDHEMSDCLLSPDGKRTLLPVIAVYGANAAGKSNYLHAIMTMRDMVVGDAAKTSKGERLPWEPFCFRDDLKSAHTSFEAVYYYQGIKYGYGYTFNEARIIEEYLYHWPNGREALVFSRKEGKYEFRENAVEQNTLANRTLENKLYLASSNEWNCPQTEKAYLWFREELAGMFQQVIDPSDTIAAMKESHDKRKNVLKELLLADLGITDVKVEELGGARGGRVITTIHRMLDADGLERAFNLPLEKESIGTQRFFARIGPWLSALDRGALLIVDEIESSMHPLLTRRLVEMVQDPAINSNGAQLLFTTHDAGLLDLTLLRRDQIWFAEREEKTAETTLYSLTDFSPRKGENVRKGYLQGRFGAIPFLAGGEMAWAESKN